MRSSQRTQAWRTTRRRRSLPLVETQNRLAQEKPAAENMLRSREEAGNGSKGREEVNVKPSVRLLGRGRGYGWCCKSSWVRLLENDPSSELRRAFIRLPGLFLRKVEPLSKSKSAPTCPLLTTDSSLHLGLSCSSYATGSVDLRRFRGVEPISRIACDSRSLGRHVSISNLG